MNRAATAGFTESKEDYVMCAEVLLSPFLLFFLKI